MSYKVKNWSGSVSFLPESVKMPSSVEEIQSIVKDAADSGKSVRLIGSGHSFTRLIETGNVLVSLDNFQGVVSVDKEKNRAVAKAGTKLKALGEMLFENGLAMENLGDIDVQSVAGAISTSTHGTGVNFGTIATQVVSMELVTGTGEIIQCSESENPEIFKAAQISLGSIGVITKMEIQCVPTYKLKYQSGKKKLQETLDKLDQYNQNRNFELYWFPYTDTVQTKVSNETTEPDKGDGFGSWFNEMVMENGLFWVLSKMSKYIPGMYKPVSKLSAWGVPATTKIGASHRVYATKRLVRFHEMEYNIPAENFKECLAEVKACIEKENFKVHFPLELRFAKQDDIWLSPAYGRDSAYIAVHMYRGMPYQEYFSAMENIFKKYNGRPHWGKRHFQTPEYLSQTYPKWEDFHRVRKELDPKGIFLNKYLRSVFGEWA